jgi:hypothetical protein
VNCSIDEAQNQLASLLALRGSLSGKDVANPDCIGFLAD